MPPPPSAAETVPATTTVATKRERADPTGFLDKTSLEVISQGSPLPPIPSFTNIEKHRHWILEHMSGAFRVFARYGFTEGLAGHISVRDPEDPHTFWTNPLRKHFGMLSPADMILVNEEGIAIGGNVSHCANAAGFFIHSAIHKARPDVNAAAHTHSKYGKAWSAFGKRLDMINQDVTMFYGDAHAVYDDFGGVVFDKEEGERLAAALGPRGKGLILMNHGLLTVGGTVDEAAYLFSLLERSCEVQLLVDATGLEKRIIGDPEAEYTFKMTSTPEVLYHAFQPNYEMEIELSNGAFLYKGKDATGA